MTRLLDWACRYAEAGWPVFPLKAREKVPATPHGCKDCTSDTGRVRAWWKGHPDHNIGLATGIVFDVLDLDGDEGIEAFDAWTGEQGWSPNLNMFPICGTGSGGQHWYVQPTGGGNRAGMLPKVDWRGAGGYVVAPPSIHPNGRTYRWLDDPLGSPIPPCPGPLAELVGRPKNERPREATFTPLRLDARGDVTPYGLKALERAHEAIAAAPQGQRNHTLNREAYGIYQLVAGSQIAERLAEDALHEAAAAGGLSAHEAKQTISSARAAGLRSPRTP